MVETANAHIARQTARGVFWNYLSYALGKALVLATTVVLARLLSPEDFGIVALATVAVNYLSIIKDFGLGAALIQNRENAEEAAENVFTLNLLLGIVLSLIAFIIAPQVARYFREPLVSPILKALGLSFTLNALGSVHVVRLRRELDFCRKIVPDLGRSVIKGGISIFLALAGFGVWALVSGQLAGVLASTILAWWVYRWKPRLVLKADLAKSLIRFGGTIFVADAVATVTDNLSYLVVGRAFGNASLGIYTLAFRLPELLVLTQLWVISDAIFPAFARIQNDAGALRSGFLLTTHSVGLFSVPLSLSLVLLADPVIRVAFGVKWLDAIPILQVLALFVLVRSTGYHAGSVYTAMGRADIVLKLELLNIIVALPALLYCSTFGLLATAVAYLAAGCIRTAAELVLAVRFLKLRWTEIAMQVRNPLMAGAALAGALLAVIYLTAGISPQAKLLAALPLAAFAYVAVIWLLERDFLLRTARRILPAKLPT